MKTVLISILLLACIGCEKTAPRNELAQIRITGGSHTFYTEPDSIDIKGGGYCVQFYDADAARRRLICGMYTISYPQR